MECSATAAAVVMLLYLVFLRRLVFDKNLEEIMSSASLLSIFFQSTTRSINNGGAG